MEPWLNLLNNFGVTTMILFALGAGSWRVLSWVGKEIVIPTRDHVFLRLAKFFDSMDASLEKLSSTAISTGTDLSRHTEILEDLHQVTATLRDVVTHKLEVLDQQSRAIEKLDATIREVIARLGPPKQNS